MTEPTRTTTPPSPVRPRAWTASLTVHVAFVTSVLVCAVGSAPETTWAGMLVTPSSPSLWAEEQFEPEPAAAAPLPQVHFEPPPPQTLLVDPVLPPLEPSELRRPTVDDEPPLPELEPEDRQPDWRARVAVRRAPESAVTTTNEPAAVAASSAAPDGAIVPPSPIAGQNPPPTYPRAARRRGIEGEVTVILEITTEGSVAFAHVEQSSGSSLLDDSALQQLSKWKFEPSRRAGIAVRSTYRTVVAFALDR